MPWYSLCYYISNFLSHETDAQVRSDIPPNKSQSFIDLKMIKCHTSLFSWSGSCSFETLSCFVIHRSKRKVLGRGDSEEERCRNIPPSPPITPTDSCPSLPSLPRQTSSIQRNLRRSSTSNDSFKALLLKKGSRSESSFRMSAAEILKYTDPRVQRAPESPQSDGLCTSPTRTRRAAEEWARTEGTLPRLSAGQTCLKYGRSRTPPSAASSRYNSRSRISSRPMTAISEREGEVAESQDCCIGADSSFTLPLSSSGTVCAQGST